MQQVQWVDCFQFLFYLYRDLENQICVEKRRLFSKEGKMLEVQKLSKLSIVCYTIAIAIDVSWSPSIHRYRSINRDRDSSIVRCIDTALVSTSFYVSLLLPNRKSITRETGYACTAITTPEYNFPSIRAVTRCVIRPPK